MIWRQFKQKESERKREREGLWRVGAIQNLSLSPHPHLVFIVDL